MTAIFLSPAEGRDRIPHIMRHLMAWPFPAGSSVAVQSSVGFSLGTTLGLERESNQDRAAAIRVCNSTGEPAWTLFALCDGMGGMAEGAHAAEIGLSTFLAEVLAARCPPTESSILAATAAANRVVFAELKGAGGATLSSVAWNSRQILTVNVGDSRIWALTKGGQLEQWTQDDTIAAQVAAEGEDAEGARKDLIQFIGIGEDLQPHFRAREPANVRMVLLSSDGAHSVQEKTLGKLAAHAQAPEEFVRRLLELSLWCGGEDNATAVSIEAAPMPRAVVGTVEVWTPHNYFRLIRFPGPQSIPDYSSGREAGADQRDQTARKHPVPNPQQTVPASPIGDVHPGGEARSPGAASRRNPLRRGSRAVASRRDEVKVQMSNQAELAIELTSSSPEPNAQVSDSTPGQTEHVRQRELLPATTPGVDRVGTSESANNREERRDGGGLPEVGPTLEDKSATISGEHAAEKSALEEHKHDGEL